MVSEDGACLEGSGKYGTAHIETYLFGLPQEREILERRP